jgi:hypothetical protein
MPSPDLTEADRAEFEKLSPKLWAALCNLLPDRNEPQHLPEGEGTYHDVMESLKQSATVTRRMIEEFYPRSPAGRLADEAIGKALAKISGPFDRHVLLSQLARRNLAINQAMADLRGARAKGGRPWKIPKRYAELLEIYLKAGGDTPTESVGSQWNAFLRGAHRKLWHLHIEPEAMRAQIRTWNRMQDGIKAGLEAEDAE